MDVFNHTVIETQVDLIDQSDNNIGLLGQSISQFTQKSLLSFKVKAYSFEMLMHE